MRSANTVSMIACRRWVRFTREWPVSATQRHTQLHPGGSTGPESTGWHRDRYVFVPYHRAGSAHRLGDREGVTRIRVLLAPGLLGQRHRCGGGGALRPTCR